MHVNGMETVGSVSNDARTMVEFEAPYVAEAVISGTAALLFHRWSVDGVAEKAKAAKGSKAKKEDNIESYVYRNAAGELALPGEYIRQAIIHAAKFKQDPRSPRKSAMDLFKAGVVSLDELCSLGTKAWDYLDRRRVMVQRSGITRVRPAMQAGWRLTVQLQVLVPEYISPVMLQDALTMAGRLVGVGDFRPTFGRFHVARFDLQSASA